MAECEECGADDVSSKVEKYSKEHYGKVYCYDCQQGKPMIHEQIDKEDGKEQISQQPTNRNKKKISPEFIIRIQNKEFITANGLLAIAEIEGGIQKIEVLNLIVNEETKSAYATIKVVMKDGREFENVGSANPDNLKENMQKNYIEMAVTRGQSRALRMGLNVDYCSAEELNE